MKDPPTLRIGKLTEIGKLRVRGQVGWIRVELAGCGNLAPQLDELCRRISEIALRYHVFADLKNCDLTDVSPLGRLTRLASLDLAGNPISDITPLSTLTNLRNLSLDRTFVSDPGPLAPLEDLTDLGLDDTRVEDLSALARLGRLRFLRARHTPVADLGYLAACRALVGLSLPETHVSDLTPIADLVELVALDLDRTRVASLESLRGSTKLKSLQLTDCPVRDLRPVSALVDLRRLVLAGTLVEDLGPLSGLANLEELDLSGTAVEDLGPLATLTSLVEINLDDTCVRDPVSLAGLSKLKHVSLRRTDVADIRAFAVLYNLQELNVRDTRVRDVSPLTALRKLRLLAWDGQVDTDPEGPAVHSCPPPQHQSFRGWLAFDTANPWVVLHDDDPEIDAAMLAAVRTSRRCPSPERMVAAWDGAGFDPIRITLGGKPPRVGKETVLLTTRLLRCESGSLRLGGLNPVIGLNGLLLAHRRGLDGDGGALFLPCPKGTHTVHLLFHSHGPDPEHGRLVFHVVPGASTGATVEDAVVDVERSLSRRR